MSITQARNGQRLHVGDRTTVTGKITALTPNTVNGFLVSTTATVQLLGTLASVSIDTRDLTGPSYNPVSGGGGSAHVTDLVSISGPILALNGNGENATMTIQLDFSGQVNCGALDCTTGGGSV